ncbi:hypothetical protein NUW54_g7396 [Trametes sanguinea]|uniref:Uncharacterized protein n=1 Tax=Trametes sanguinea TaxID=158606 RepID=A0ACC1PKW1_9APHY|nr:hypothetical protein NUW54_g7396 [Trametes sanguinea]
MMVPYLQIIALTFLATARHRLPNITTMRHPEASPKGNTPPSALASCAISARMWAAFAPQWNPENTMSTALPPLLFPNGAQLGPNPAFADQ